MQDGRAQRVGNRAPAAIQITTEQILREAQELQETALPTSLKERLVDSEEVHEYQDHKRKEFEGRVRRTKGSIKEWLQYASWEATQSEFARSRSIFERALDVDPRNVQLWLSYTEMELKSRNIQHACTLFDRAVTILPRASQLWYKYTYLEELLQNVSRARQVFERWMQWEPEDEAWQSYIKFEERYAEFDRVSAVYERWAKVRSEPKVYVKWARYEEGRGRLNRAREVLMAALELYEAEEEGSEEAQVLFSALAKMETRAREYERARIVYKSALARIPQSKCTDLYASYTTFEKQHGTESLLKNTVLEKRRAQYEDELMKDKWNYDVWYEYAQLEESAWHELKGAGTTSEELASATGLVRDVYERAIAQVPPSQEKPHWRRYIFIWIYYALFEEIEVKDYEHARQVYHSVISLVPHKQFTFTKLWLMLAKFEIRQLDLPAARKILGTGIGMCPNDALFEGYIDLEIELCEFDRARTLYEKYLEFDPKNTPAWIAYATLEAQLHDPTRARAIFELGISQSQSRTPELLWKTYIDFEQEQDGGRERTAALYERLVALGGDVKAWVAYALFLAEDVPVERVADRDGEMEEEIEAGEMEPRDPALARSVFRRGYHDLKARGLNTERVALLEVWKAFEERNGSANDLATVQCMMPIKAIQRREHKETGEIVEVEEYVFADDKETNPSTFELLQAAHAWKDAQAVKNTDC
ncbi:Pre-mRNA-splicing factor CLF1 [Hypsizygus marmoreus]|uniref:Pre-mRNA-splicing factor CLF1 n=1 Tax=Hypsizygus marmoreus TaxID=39966 RepID=A0A369K5F1_HYPMA|nr:Pre-mRNA-splicing factor CLF1 [Hypsizygus marmoreus]